MLNGWPFIADKRCAKKVESRDKTKDRKKSDSKEEEMFWSSKQVG